MVRETNGDLPISQWRIEANRVQLEKSNREHDEQMKRLLEKIGELSPPSTTAATNSGTNGDSLGGTTPPSDDAGWRYRDTPVPDYTEGQFFPDTPAPGYPVSNISSTKRMPLMGTFGPGFQFQTEDEEFRLQVHLESQIDARIWGQRDQVPANSGIFLPRQRIFFDGNITKRIEYEFSINRGLGGTINILNAFINLHFDDRFQLRFGRFFTPFTYDQYAISNYWLPTPERSLFTTNVGLGRQIGLMGWGYLFDKRLDYAAGVFNGSRNSFESLNNGVDFVAFLNARPFQESESLEFARFLNLGTSVAFGHQDQPAGARGVPHRRGFPEFRRPRARHDAIPDPQPRRDRARRPVAGVRPFGLLLQEPVADRRVAIRLRQLRVARPPVVGAGAVLGLLRRRWLFPDRRARRAGGAGSIRCGRFVPTKKGDPIGPGAWEVVGRVSELRLGEKIFTSGFADPNLWSNQADHDRTRRELVLE